MRNRNKPFFSRRFALLTFFFNPDALIFRRFDSEALLQTHLHRKKIRIARTPLLMTAVRTDEFMKHAKIRYNPTSIAQVLATEGFPAACAPSLWSLVAGSQAECPRCCTQGETEEALQAANETRNASPMRNTSSGPSAPRNVCWGAGFWAGFSYTGVEMEAERGGGEHLEGRGQAARRGRRARALALDRLQQRERRVALRALEAGHAGAERAVCAELGGPDPPISCGITQLERRESSHGTRLSFRCRVALASARAAIE